MHECFQNLLIGQIRENWKISRIATSPIVGAFNANNIQISTGIRPILFGVVGPALNPCTLPAPRRHLPFDHRLLSSAPIYEHRPRKRRIRPFESTSKIKRIFLNPDQLARRGKILPPQRPID